MENGILLCFLVFYILALAEITVSLRCYSCAPVGASTMHTANVKCLAASTEVTCTPDQDRCFSLGVGNSNNEVAKGCTQSQDCLGSRICCHTDFCNAGTGMVSQTGYGRPCMDLSTCVQGADDMSCQKEKTTDMEKRCLCTTTRYVQGAICKRRSYPNEECATQDHCMNANTTCLDRICRCPVDQYANLTACDPKRKLRESCTAHVQCLTNNSECNGLMCVCKFGYFVNNGTDTCSGSPRATEQTRVGFLLMTLITIMVLQKYFLCDTV